MPHVTGYGVYVVRLSDGSLYVGSTALPFEERLRQHQAGGRLAAQVGDRRFVKLAPALYRHLPRFEKRHQAERAERQLANSLRHRFQTPTLRVFGGTRPPRRSRAVPAT